MLQPSSRAPVLCKCVVTNPYMTASETPGCGAQVPNGEMTAEQMRYMGGAIKPFGADGEPHTPLLLKRRTQPLEGPV